MESITSSSFLVDMPYLASFLVSLCIYYKLIALFSFLSCIFIVISSLFRMISSFCASNFFYISCSLRSNSFLNFSFFFSLSRSSFFYLAFFSAFSLLTRDSPLFSILGMDGCFWSNLSVSRIWDSITSFLWAQSSRVWASFSLRWDGVVVSGWFGRRCLPDWGFGGRAGGGLGF